MSEQLLSTLTVSFDKDQLNNGDGLKLEKHTGFTGLRMGIPFRQYPQCPARLVCSYGRISSTPESRKSFEKEVVAFSGSNSASLKYSVVESVNASLIGGTAFDEEGNVVYPSVNYSSEKNQLVSDIKFYGAVEVTYQAPYYLYYYEFNQGVDPISNIVTIGGSDTIHAFYKKNHAQLDMELKVSFREDWLPFYRVYTKIVLDELGVWEYPLNWVTDDTTNKNKSLDDPTRKKHNEGTFGSWSTYKINPDASFTDERVHQTGEYDFLGRLKTSTPNDILGIQSPYWGRTSLDFAGLARAGLIQFRIKFVDKPKWKKSMVPYTEKNLFDAYYSIDKAQIIADLADDYPNLVDDDGN